MSEFFKQFELRFFHDFVDALLEFKVIDSIVQIIALPGAGKVTENVDVGDDRLAGVPLFRKSSDDDLCLYGIE